MSASDPAFAPFADTFPSVRHSSNHHAHIPSLPSHTPRFTPSLPTTSPSSRSCTSAYTGTIMSWRFTANLLDGEIEELQTRLQELRNKRNSITPIYQIPDDIVARILLMVQLDLQPNDARLSVDFVSFGRPLGLKKPGWVISMLVCKRFREAALSSAVLWASIDLESRKNSDWAHLCRERATGCLLDLNGIVDASYTGSTDLTFAYLAHSRRVRVMLTTSEIQNYLDFSARLEQQLSIIHPLLTDLDIANLGDNEAFPPWEPPPITLITPSFLGGADINLTSLWLMNVDWTDPPLMPALKTLTLSECVIDESCRNVLALFRQTPIVTHMILLYPKLRFDVNAPGQLHFPTEHPGKNGMVQLSELMTLTLSGALPLLALVLRILPTPKAYLDITTTSTDDREGHHEWLTSLDERFSSYILTRLGASMSEMARQNYLEITSATMRTYYSEVIDLHVGPVTYDTNTFGCVVKCDLFIVPDVTSLGQLMQHVRHLIIPDAEDLSELSLVLRPCLNLDFLSVANVGQLASDLTFPNGASDSSHQQALIQQKEHLKRLLEAQASAQGFPIPRLVLSCRRDCGLPVPDVCRAVAAEWKRAEWVKDIEWV